MGWTDYIPGGKKFHAVTDRIPIVGGVLGGAFNADEPYEQAAEGAERAGAQFRDLRGQMGEQWREGMGAAQGYQMPGYQYALNTANQGPGVGEQAYSQVAPTYQEPGFGETVGYRTYQSLQQPGEMSQFAQGQGRQLEDPGMYEQFVQGAMSGNDPALELARREGLASINQEQARRGHFESTGADKQVSDFNARLEADRYRQMADMARGSQEMQMGRLAQGQGLAAGTSGERMAQLGMGLGAGAQAQNFAMDRAAGLMDAAGAAQGLQMGRQGQAYDMLSGSGNALAGTTAGFYGMGLGLESQLESDAINAQNMGAQQRAAGTQAGYNAPWETFNKAASAYKTYQTSGMG